MFRSALCAFGRIESKSHTNLCHGMSYQVCEHGSKQGMPLTLIRHLSTQLTQCAHLRWQLHHGKLHSHDEVIIYLASQLSILPPTHPFRRQQTADSPFLGEFFDASYSYSKATAKKPPSARMTWLLALGSETPKLGILMPLFPSALTIHLFNLTIPHSPVQGRRKALLSKWTENTRVEKTLEEKVFVISQEDSGEQIQPNSPGLKEVCEQIWEIKRVKGAVVFRIQSSACGLTSADASGGIPMQLGFIIYVMTYAWTLIRDHIRSVMEAVSPCFIIHLSEVVLNNIIRE